MIPGNLALSILIRLALSILIRANFVNACQFRFAETAKDILS